MKRACRTWRLLASGALLGLTMAAAGGDGAAAQLGSAYAVLDEVNALRATYGLAPFAVDPILMAVAQRNADCGAAAGGLSHTCVDGMRPRDRAIAAGYGAGETVFVSENIMEGTGLTPAEAVQWWTGDEPHLNTMIGQYYRDAGAGYAEVDGYAYYVLMSGYVAGGYSASGYYSPATLTAAAAPPPPVPVFIATPGPDGSIVHEVQQGQSLWTIAAVYGVDVETVRGLNGYAAEPLLHPGDRVIVRGPTALTPTGTPMSGGSIGTVTELPGPLARVDGMPATAEAEIGQPSPAAAFAEADARQTLSVVFLAIGGVAAALGVALALRRR
jgi:LysM repeat protein